MKQMAQTELAASSARREARPRKRLRFQADPAPPPPTPVTNQPQPLPFRPVPNASSKRFRTPRSVTLVARVIPESIPPTGDDAVSPDFFSSCCSAARTSLTNAAGGARPVATALRNPAAFAYVTWSAVLRTSSASAAAASIRAISALSRRPAKRPPLPASWSLYRSRASERDTGCSTWRGCFDQARSLLLQTSRVRHSLAGEFGHTLGLFLGLEPSRPHERRSHLQGVRAPDGAGEPTRPTASTP